MSQISTIRFATTNDINGNPRRVFVTFRNGAIIATYDEGYEGEQAITNHHHRNAYAGCTLMTTPAEYRSLIKLC